MLLDLVHKGAQQPHTDLVGPVVVVSVSREIALDLVILGNAVLVTDNLYLGVLDGGQGVDHVGKSRDTGGKGTFQIRIHQRKLRCLVIIFVMHVLDQVQRIHIQIRQPLHHVVVALHNLVVIQILGSDRTVLGSYLIAGLLIHAAIYGVEQTLRQVCPGAEELHLLARLGRGHAAADRVVVAPYRLHGVVVLILHGAGLDGNAGSIILESFRQSGGIEYGQVRLGSRSHILQRVQETEIGLRHHASSIYAGSGHIQGRPYRVAGEQLVVGGDPGKFYHTKLHGKVIDQLLCLGLSQDTLLQVTLNIDIQEGGDTSHAHGRAVLGLDSCQISEIQPLHCLLGVLRGSGNVVSVDLCHFLHVFQGTDLLGDLLTQTDHFALHAAAAAFCLVFLLALDQMINTVEGHPTVIADDTSTAIGVGKSGNDLVVAGLQHLRCVGVKDCRIVGLVILGKNFNQFRVYFISVIFAGLHCHLDSTVGHERSLQRLVCLQSDNLLQVLHGLVNVSGAVCGKGGHHFSLHIQDAALGSLFLLQLLQRSPELIGSFRRTCQEGFVSIVWLVVILNELPDIDFLFPESALKSIPFFHFYHASFPPSICYG